MLPEKLEAAVRAGTAVFVVGTGASKAMSNNHHYADWPGLVSDGLERARRSSGGAKAQFYTTYGDVLQGSPDAEDLVIVASFVQQQLTQGGTRPYSEWLRETVGELQCVDPALGLALKATQCPILTTNYDTLLEKATGLPSASWMDAEGLSNAIRNSPPQIGHLHGVWDKPDSVILSDRDYERVTSSAPSQHLQAALYATKTWVFVGYGAGLSDPNFGQMLKVHKAMFPNSSHNHYRLALAGDVAALEAEHRQDNIQVVSYGDNHSDLIPFIRSLTKAQPSAPARSDYVAFARESILTSLREDAIQGNDGAVDLSNRSLADLTIPPVFLPMPHEQFVVRQDKEEGSRPKVVDPISLIAPQRAVLVVGEEGAGITTALRWLLTSSSEAAVGVAPLYVDARRARGSSYALDKLIRQEALDKRLIDAVKDPLPPHAIAVDNLTAARNLVYRSIVADLARSKADAIYLGTRQGNEADLLELLSEEDVETEVVYLGKPGRAQIQRLAKLIAPDVSPSLIKQVLRVIRRERLQRTPFNICMLLILLSNGGVSVTNASDTAVLDKYVQLLTGRTGNFLDPRWTLDPQNRESVLADLAMKMVRDRTGSLPRRLVEDHLKAYFEDVDWDESPADTVDSFTRMRVLRINGEQVRFQQTAYLHLFAAKAAVNDESFRDELLSDDLFFAPIIRHYAGLVRNSERVVSLLHTTLVEDWPVSPPTGPAFDPVLLTDALDAGEEAGDDAEPVADQNSDGPGTDVEVYDSSADNDAEPFPLDDPSDWPDFTKLSRLLDLASRVVRDSDTIRNLDLKDQLLVEVLERWGYLLDMYTSTPALHDMATEITDLAIEEGITDEEDRDAEQATWLQIISAFSVFAGIASTLASRKLLKALVRATAEKGEQRVYIDISAAMLAISTNATGWASHLEPVAAKHGDLGVVRNFFLPIALVIHGRQRLSEADLATVEAFIRDALAKQHRFENAAHQKQWTNTQLERLRRQRKLSQRKWLPEGELATDELTAAADVDVDNDNETK